MKKFGCSMPALGLVALAAVVAMILAGCSGLQAWPDAAKTIDGAVDIATAGTMTPAMAVEKVQANAAYFQWLKDTKTVNFLEYLLDGKHRILVSGTYATLLDKDAALADATAKATTQPSADAIQFVVEEAKIKQAVRAAKDGQP